MPQLGEIRKGKEIGFEYHKVIWAACEGCGKERWVVLYKGKPRYPNCHRCAMIGKHPTEEHRAKLSKALKGRFLGQAKTNWNGGRRRAGAYILIRLYPDDFFYPMVRRDGYVLEHRLVVAKALGRCLHSWEIVHHKDGCSKDDNQYPKTLQLVTNDRHTQITIMENRIKQLENRVTLLEAENILLRDTAQRILE